MSQLIRATITPFESVSFKQNASLVSSQMLDSARRQAIARQHAFNAQNAVNSNAANSDYMNQVRRAFASGSMTAAVPQSSQAAAVSQQIQAAIQAQASVQDQAQAAYTVERGSFEMQVARGDLTFVPAMVMTVITQYPDVQFEYLGGIQYVPPSAAPTGENIDISL